MNAKETALAAYEWKKFTKTKKYRDEQEADRKRRIAADISVGHLPTCGILKCDPRCTKGK